MRSFLLLVAGLSLAACGSSPTPGLDEGSRLASAPFPSQPVAEMTPGTVCTRPDTYRYPEKIPYCERDVSSGTKWEIIHDYDREFGFRIGSMNRADFKIDHYIPLCMGGSNEVRNLWPQHKSVYVLTDGIEQKACELMAKGQLKQIDAIKIIRRAKNDLSEAPAIEQDLEGQLH